MGDMAGPDDQTSNGHSTLKIETRALSEIGLNNLLAEQGTSSDDEGAPEALDDDTRATIGVSIGREQTRLTSPTTPAIEKAAAIERAGGFFPDSNHATLVEEPEEQDEEDTEAGAEPEHTPPQARPNVPQRTAGRADVQLPSPWRAQGDVSWKTSGKSRSGLLDGIFSNRKRASSGPSNLDGWQKSLMSTLPSLPSISKPFSISSPFSGSSDETKTPTQSGSQSSRLRSLSDLDGPDTRKGHQRSKSDLRPVPDYFTAPTEEVESRDDLSLSPSLQTTPSGPRLLRRSTSDHSLTTLRTISTSMSLGDDTRFENIQDQVNSRFKAIKDSWADSSIKLPQMPNLSNFTPDFLRERAGSLNKRQSIKPSPGEKPVDPMTRQPYTTAKAVMADASNSKPATHPHFHRALEQLKGDVVVLGGYRGSILRSAEPPHRQLWVPVKVGLNIRKVNLEVGIDEDGDERAIDTIIPGGTLSHIGPVDISRRLLKRLRTCENARTGSLRVHDYGYDWRLTPSYLSKQLTQFIEGLPCNLPGVPKEERGATVIAHSLGGLITRHAVNHHPELFRGIVYAGVPHTCVNILGPLRNGDEVLLSDKVLTAQVNFTMRTSFALLPLDGRCFFDKETGEEYPVDFFDVNTWIDQRLSPCVARPLPPLNPQPKPSGIAGYVTSISNALPSLPFTGNRKDSLAKPKDPLDPSKAATAAAAAEPDMSTQQPADDNESETTISARAAVTLPKDKAIAYLTRTLASVKKFKQDTSFRPELASSNAYPPISVIYGKSTPTVYGAKVNGREGIKHADAYDELAFASGDGVVLARAAMVPDGYTTARGGVVASTRGHVTLLGDLEAVGRCLNAVIRARRKGVGLGVLEGR